MSESNGRGRFLLIVLVVLLVLSAACCCGGFFFLRSLPSILLDLVTEDQPLSLAEVPRKPNMDKKLGERFEAGGPVHITGEELVQLVDPQKSDVVDAFMVEIEGDKATVDMSLHVEGEGLTEGYVNIHATGAATIEHGWFTHLVFDDLKVASYDLGQYIAGQDLSTNANQSLANSRADNPEAAVVLDEIEHLEFADGELVVELQEGGWERIQASQKDNGAAE